MQNYKIPLVYYEYANGIYSLLTKKKMSNRVWLFIFSSYLGQLLCYCLEEFHGVDNICELYMKKKPKTFRDLFAIKYRDRADEIIAILHEMIDGCTEAKDVVKPIRAAMDAGIIDRPSWPIFIAEFPEAKCGKSSLERRTNPDDDYYRIKYKGTYEDLVEYFANL